MHKFSVKKIVWKETDGGGFKALCGGVSVGFIRRSLTNKEIYYPSILNDKFKLKTQEYTSLDEAKKVFEKAFNEIISNFIEVE
jgi:hypothetical protein